MHCDVSGVEQLPANMSLSKEEQYCFAVARFCGSRSQGWSDSFSGTLAQDASDFHLLAKQAAVCSMSPSGVMKSSFWFSENVPQSPLVSPDDDNADLRVSRDTSRAEIRELIINHEIREERWCKRERPRPTISPVHSADELPRKYCSRRVSWFRWQPRGTSPDPLLQSTPGDSV